MDARTLESEGCGALEGVITLVRDMELSLKTVAFRTSVIVGLITAVATVLYFTPLPGECRPKCCRHCNPHGKGRESMRLLVYGDVKVDVKATSIKDNKQHYTSAAVVCKAIGVF